MPDVCFQRKDRKGNGGMRFTNASVLNDGVESMGTVTSGQDISIALDYDIHDSNALHNAVVQIEFSGILGRRCLRACLAQPLVNRSPSRPAHVFFAIFLACRLDRGSIHTRYGVQWVKSWRTTCRRLASLRLWMAIFLEQVSFQREILAISW